MNERLEDGDYVFGSYFLEFMSDSIELACCLFRISKIVGRCAYFSIYSFRFPRKNGMAFGDSVTFILGRKKAMWRHQVKSHNAGGVFHMTF